MYWLDYSRSLRVGKIGLAVAIAICALLVIFLPGQSFVMAQIGEIRSQSPAVILKAHTKSAGITAHVTSGTHVHAGDLLFTLHSVEVAGRERLAQQDRRVADGRMALLKSQLELLVQSREEELQRQDGESATSQRRVSSLKRRKQARQQELTMLESQVRAQADRAARLKKASEQQYVSLEQANEAAMDLLSIQRSKADLLDSISALEQQVRDEQAELATASHSIERSIADIDARISTIRSDLLEGRKSVIAAQSSLNASAEETRKMQVRAPVNGVVHDLIGESGRPTMVDPGAVLGTISPDNNRFYAQLPVAQGDVDDVRPGQSVIVLLDRYSTLRNGVCRGTVRYIGRGAEMGEFYAIVDLEPNAILRDGMRVSGRILLERTTLWRSLAKAVLGDIYL